MKKICFYTDTIFTLGGIQKIVTMLCNQLSDYYEITVICQHKNKKSEMVDYELKKNIRVKIIDNNFIISDTIIFAPIKAIRLLIKKLKLAKTRIGKKILKMDYRIIKRKRTIDFLNKENFDYIIAESIDCCIYLSSLKDRINSTIIGCWHSSYANYLLRLEKTEIENSIKKLDNTIVLSEYDVQLIKKDFNLDVECIYNFIRSEKIEYNKNIKEKIFLTVGRYDSFKGYDRLIRIFYKFYKNNKEWKLLIVGEGPDRKRLQSIIDELNLNDNVVLTGKTNKVEEYYNKASIFLFSSYGEGFPMVILEAMKYRLPIISFDIPVLHEMLPSSEYIVKQVDEEKYLSFMEKLSKDTDLLEKIGKQNAEKCKEFYEDRIITKWKELLK